MEINSEGRGSISRFRNILRHLFGRHIDWLLLFGVIPLVVAGLLTMNSFVGENPFYHKQFIWIVISLSVFFLLSKVDFHFLRRTGVLVTLYLIALGFLVSLFVAGSVLKGAQSWFVLGLLSFQPTEPAILILILVLAKYFSRRHIEIAHIKHILISGLYALVLFLLVLVQPDFGSAIIIFIIWLSMVLVAGISKKHLALVFAVGALAFSFLWFYGFAPYQKDRILTFIHPLTDIHGAGYNAYQSTIAVGSGELFGKGIGYGTQSKLQFLPEYQTDFIFAAFAEEWGFFGVLMLLGFFVLVIWRILKIAEHGESNFEILYGTGLAILFITHFTIHVGINVGLLPVTGTTIPFLSYGGSHLLTEFTGLGILMGMRQYSRGIHRDDAHNEIVGV
ncbi:MAG: FtsW/RodA/SpoVE family cell cycle protein [bacterium]|nr:FtsW/RodA/SpoVE family cell cycle protein [bacterium]